MAFDSFWQIILNFWLKNYNFLSLWRWKWWRLWRWRIWWWRYELIWNFEFAIKIKQFWFDFSSLKKGYGGSGGGGYGGGGSGGGGMNSFENLNKPFRMFDFYHLKDMVALPVEEEVMAVEDLVVEVENCLNLP